MKNILSFIVVNILLVSSVYATGPSYIQSTMNPVAVNSKGDVLCYTRYVKNEMGAHYPMPIVYGYCILTQDTIIHYTMHVLKWDEENEDLEAYSARHKLWESVYKGRFKKKYLTEAIREQYNFGEEGVARYKVSKTMPLTEFNTMTGVDLMKTRQKALFGAVSKNDYSQHGKKVHVLYDFGNVVVLQNSSVEDEENYGSIFNYINYLFPNVGYEYNTVTGVVFTNKKLHTGK